MIAATRRDVDDLNNRARQRLAVGGHLHGPRLSTAAGRDFRAGDHVMALRNDYRLGVVNGTRGIIRRVDPLQRSVTILVNSDDITLPSTYLDDGHLAHGYAITCHKAQGLTVDRAWVLVTGGTYREWAYVALSRSLKATTIYLTDTHDQAAEELHRQGSDTRADPFEATLAALQRTRAQQLAHEHTVDRGPELGIA